MPEWIVIINAILGWVFALWEKAQQIEGGTLPDWDMIASKNARLQAKIDAEKE